MAVVADRRDLQPCDPVSASILATGDEQAGGIGYLDDSARLGIRVQKP